MGERRAFPFGRDAHRIAIYLIDRYGDKAETIATTRIREASTCDTERIYRHVRGAISEERAQRAGQLALPWSHEEKEQEG